MRDLVIDYLAVIGVIFAMGMLLGFIAWELFLLGRMEQKRFRDALRREQEERERRK